jgi:phosphoglycolate phosphatase
MKYRAVLWDWDGTLFDSDREVYRACCVAYARYNLPIEPYEEFRHRADNQFVHPKGQVVPEGVIQEIRRIFFDHFNGSSCDLIESASEVLDRLSQRSVPNSIVSAHPANDIVRRLRYFGIRHHFNHVIGGISQKRDAIRSVCADLKVAPQKALFVGDLLSDVKDGNAAGVHTVLYAPADSPHTSHPTYHITHLREVLSLLET